MKQDANNNRGDSAPAFVERRLREMAEGLTEAIDKEVSRRQQEGLPIHVCENGKVIDLQESHSD